MRIGALSTISSDAANGGAWQRPDNIARPKAHVAAFFLLSPPDSIACIALMLHHYLPCTGRYNRSAGLLNPFVNMLLTI